MHVLLVEDDRCVAEYLVQELGRLDIQVDWTDDGAKGLRMAHDEGYDALILDREVPSMDGLTVLQTLRADGIRTPALILSVLGYVDERIRGLRAGADDYLTKPYVLSELHARLEAIVRWRDEARAPQHSEVLRVGDLELDIDNHQVRRGSKAVLLQPRELRLLEYLMRHAGHVVTRGMLCEAMWTYRFRPQANALDVHISRLRQKVDKEFGTPIIHTVRGAGFCLRADGP